MQDPLFHSGVLPMKSFVFLALSFFLISAHAQFETIYRVDIKHEKDYKKYSDKDLKRRVWELERAVWQLQQKVFQLENGTPAATPTPNPEAWVCTIKAMGKAYMGTGASKAVASMKALEKCQADGNSSMFCDKLECDQ